LPPALKSDWILVSVGAAALVRAPERGGGGPGGLHQLGVRQAGGTDLPLQPVDVGRVNRLALGGRNRVLPQQRLGGHIGPQIAGARAHVAVGQLEPRLGEGELERLSKRSTLS